MSDVVPYRPDLPTPDGFEWARESPSEYWHIRIIDKAHVVNRRGGRSECVRIVFEHIAPEGHKVVVEGLIKSREELLRMKGFLDAAVELPVGARISAHTVEPQPWDKNPASEKVDGGALEK